MKRSIYGLICMITLGGSAYGMNEKSVLEKGWDRAKELGNTSLQWVYDHPYKASAIAVVVVGGGYSLKQMFTASPEARKKIQGVPGSETSSSAVQSLDWLPMLRGFLLDVYSDVKDEKEKDNVLAYLMAVVAKDPKQPNPFNSMLSEFVNEEQLKAIDDELSKCRQTMFAYLDVLRNFKGLTPRLAAFVKEKVEFVDQCLALQVVYVDEVLSNTTEKGQ